MLETILIYLLAISVGMAVAFVSGFPFGLLLSAIPRLPRFMSGNLHYGKFYLHGIWFLTAFTSTLTSYGIMRAFSIQIGWVFAFLLMIQPALAFNSDRLRKPENLGYFNSLTSPELATGITPRQMLFVNRMEAITKFISICLCLFVVGGK